MANLRYLKNRSRWWVRWRAKSRKSNYVFEGSKVFLEKTQAIKFYAEIEEQERLVRSGSVTPGETIADIIVKFKQHIKRHTSRTQKHYRSVIDRFAASLHKSVVRIHQLEQSHIRDYLYGLRDAGNKNRTLNAHLTVLKSFCRYYSNDLGIDNPASKVSMLTEDPPEHRFLTYEEYLKILEVAHPLAKPRIIFLANTGLRASEFAGLECVSPQATSITITGKGRKRRTVPLNQSARNVVPELSICSRRALYSQCQLLARRAGIPVFGPHALRHYFATQLLLKGVPIIKVSKLLGHESVKTTQQIYAHILPDDMANSTDVLDV
jgi:site-specific recombinase XerD